MAKPYSYDFRKKVIQAVELDGLKKSEACQLFNISRNTLNLWFQRRAETGDIHPKKRQSSPKNQKITNWENFRAFANANSDKTQAEMAELWEGELSARTISRALSKINFTRKKKHMGIGKERRRKEQPFLNN
jgi:transposase